ncbi:MAG TPA: hypothetical protein VEY11_00535 [Pyrinomonadaceae bacterium]|nr:hypothetical protein [Pyrinomonadaceae bacterium]
MLFTVFKLRTTARRLIPAATLALLLVASARAQSIDPNSPTPVVSNEIAGSIAPLDIGDARSTRFFYTFSGLQGDLELTVESFNLEGDVDIFVANNMRPLTKVTLYAGTSANRSAKTVYLRRDEPLILRVQARTPNDAEGTYRIRLGGAFRPASPLATEGGVPGDTTAANTGATGTAPTGANRKVRRVSSVGARIEEPVVEVAREEPARPEPAPAPPAAAGRTSPNPKPARSRSGARRTSRAETARRNSPNREAVDGDAQKAGASKDETANAAKASDAPNGNEATESVPRPKAERARPVRVPRARGNRNTTTARRTGATPAEPVPSSPEAAAATPAPASARLVLVMRDGETFERDMSSIRRVTVENGVLVIVSKTGKTERQPMTAVLRMSIEP